MSEPREMEVRATQRNYASGYHSWHIEQFVDGEWKKIPLYETEIPCIGWKRDWWYLTSHCVHCGKSRAEHSA